MSDMAQQPKLSVRQLLPTSLAGATAAAGFVLFYGTVLGALNLLGFWMRFRINPFNYAGPSDLAISSAPTAVFLALSGLIGVALGIALGRSSSRAVARPTRSALSRRMVRLIALAILLAPLVMFFRSPHAPLATFWFVLGTFGPIMLCLALFTDIRKRVEFHTVVLVVVIGYVFPGASMAFGAAMSAFAERPETAHIVDMDRSSVPFRSGGAVGYLGTLGDHHFFLELKTGSVALVSGDAAPVIVLNHDPRTREYRPLLLFSD